MEMTQKELDDILKKHREYMITVGTSGKLADLIGANLSGANLDYSSIPLKCTSLTIKCDTRLMAQLAFHLLRMDSAEARELLKITELRILASKFHRFAECGGLPEFTKGNDTNAH